jgi:hypothetical protein
MANSGNSLAWMLKLEIFSAETKKPAGAGFQKVSGRS